LTNRVCKYGNISQGQTLIGGTQRGSSGESENRGEIEKTGLVGWRADKGSFRKRVQEGMNITVK